MNVYGTLKKAQIESSATDLSGLLTGIIFWNTVDGRPKVGNGTICVHMLTNDQKCIFGTNGTANNNVRFNRAANALLQLVVGGDSTAEGSLSTALAQISAKQEGYTNAGKPAAGNGGRLAWITDLLELQVDTGTAWVSIGGKGTVTTKAADAALTAAEFKNGFVKLDATSAQVALIMPTAADIEGYSCTFKVTNADNLAKLTGTFDGDTDYVFQGVNDKVTIFCDGTNFYIKG